MKSERIVMVEKYWPIDCGFHDLLLDRATRQSMVLLEYSNTGNRIRKEVVIKDVYTLEGEEFLSTAEGETIRLDQIIRIDGIKRPDNNFC